MVIRKIRGESTRGAAAVETAMVMIRMLMFVFGIFEYGRLLMDWNLLNNAAREGCRYALANNTSYHDQHGRSDDRDQLSWRGETSEFHQLHRDRERNAHAAGVSTRGQQPGRG